MTIASPSLAVPALPASDVSGMAELTHLGVIRATGEDAATFLQGQLTQDVLSLGLSEARLAAFCNAKGRMQASFVVFKRNENEILLLCSRDILPATLKRRAYLVHTDSEPAVGQEVFSAMDAEQPCGLVAACAPNPAGGFDAIVSMQTAAAAEGAGQLTLSSAAGPSLHLLPLPYKLLEDI